MAAIRSRGNRNTELRFADILRRNGIRGWRRHQKLPGSPDFIFRKAGLAIFVDGCFWHGCPTHGHRPRSNQRYWHPKLERTKARDLAYTKLLRRKGWLVLRIWEHELPSETKIVTRCKNALRQASQWRPKTLSARLLPARLPVYVTPRSPKLDPKRRNIVRQQNPPSTRRKENNPGPVQNPSGKA